MDSTDILTVTPNVALLMIYLYPLYLYLHLSIFPHLPYFFASTMYKYIRPYQRFFKRMKFPQREQFTLMVWLTRDFHSQRQQIRDVCALKCLRFLKA